MRRALGRRRACVKERWSAQHDPLGRVLRFLARRTQASGWPVMAGPKHPQAARPGAPRELTSVERMLIKAQRVSQYHCAQTRRSLQSSDLRCALLVQTSETHGSLGVPALTDAAAGPERAVGSRFAAVSSSCARPGLERKLFSAMIIAACAHAANASQKRDVSFIGGAPFAGGMDACPPRVCSLCFGLDQRYARGPEVPRQAVQCGAPKRQCEDVDARA